MKEAILLEPHFFPNIQYLSKFLLYNVVILDDIQLYQKQSYRNRALIAGSNQLLTLTIPLTKGKTKQPIDKVQIADKLNWQREHWESIRSAYGKAPFFEYYSDSFKPFFQTTCRSLLEFDLALMDTLLNMLRIQAKYQLRSQIDGNLEDVTDFRGYIHPKKTVNDPDFKQKPYNQVFQDRLGFIENLSGIDLLFNEGPSAKMILKNCIKE